MSLFAALALLPLLSANPGTLDPFPTPISPPLFPGVRSLLWIGAHPDDEVLAAPALARLCRSERLDCHFLVLTRGEAGICLLPGGCLPDLASVRTLEMQRSAALFGAGLTQWTLPDGGGAAGWDAASGGHAALVARLVQFLRTTAPDLVLTFDPRHGTTCHGDHRAAAELALEARSAVAPQPVAYLLETRAAVTAAPPYVQYSAAASARASAFGYAATADRDGVAGTWGYSAAAARLHRSQFAAETVRALGRLPADQRVVYLAPAEPVLEDDDVEVCP
jgi:LmbE family N-acetylglucosaminyl deacetylase